jgi:hypothetical protein
MGIERWCSAGRTLLPLLVLAAAACGRGEPRLVEDAERGCRYVVPRGWVALGGEVRSRAGSLLTVRVFDLEGADRRFVAGLPETLVPQLEGWARAYYLVEGPPERSPAVIGGEEALELAYTIRVRAGKAPSTLVYWIVRSGQRLYVLRCVFPADGRARDQGALDELLASWAFTGTAGRAEPPPAPPAEN